MTGSEFYTYLLREFKRDDKETEAYDAITDTVKDMKLTIFEILDGQDEYSLFTINQNDYIVQLPTEFGHLVSDVQVEDTNSNDVYNLKKVSLDALQTRYPDLPSGDTTSVPDMYAIYGGNIYFGPAFDGDQYRVRLTYTDRQATDITSATDPVPFSDRYREILKHGVIARLYAGMQNYADSREYYALYENGKNKIRAISMHNSNSDDGVVYHGI